MQRGVSLDAPLAYPGRATRALVDLDALRRNVDRLRTRAGEHTDLMAVVKADGYGHGAVTIAREALAAGATWLGVATVAEGRELRSAGFIVPILILGPIDGFELDVAAELGLDVTVGEDSLVDDVVARAAADCPCPRLHLKVDTGMHRYGVAPGQVVTALRRLEAASPGSVYALVSHFAAADMPDHDATRHQLSVLTDVTQRARQVRPDLAIHVANSAATIAGLAPGAAIARVGIAMYGCGGNVETRSDVGLEQVMSVVSRLMRVHELQLGDGVSYGHTYVAAGRERVGLIPIGYADGYQRSLSDRGWMTLAKSVLPVRGRVCMDQTIVGDVPATAPTGTWVGVAGPALGGPSWDALAKMAGTISYELLTSVGRRVARIYHRSGRIVAVRDELGYLREVDDNNKAPTTVTWSGPCPANRDP